MTEIKSDSDNFSEYYKKINNELVIPSYRRFCKSNKLSFHFWDELQHEKFDPKIAQHELRLQKEAMDLFNSMKNYYEYFNGEIFKFRFTDWGGEFNYEKYSISEFMKLTERLEKKLEKEKKVREVIVVIASFSMIVTLLVVFYIINLLFKINATLYDIISVAISFGAGLSLEFLVRKYFSRKENYLQNKINNRIIQLRLKIKSICEI